MSCNLMMAAILNSTILDSVILHKKNFTHSFWLNLMMETFWNSAILDSDTAILDWDTLLSSLRFTQNTLTPHWIWLKLIQSDSNSFILTSLDDVSHLEFCHLGFNHFEQIKTSLIHCHSTWGWQPSWILPSWIQPLCTKNFTHSFWLNLMMAAI